MSQIIMAKCSFVYAAVQAQTQSQTLFTKFTSATEHFSRHKSGNPTPELSFSCKINLFTRRLSTDDRHRP